MTSAFDEDKFLDATTTEAGTRRPPLPNGRDFIGVIGKPKARTAQGKKDPTKEYTFIDFPIEIDLNAYPDVKSVVGVDKVTLVHGISLQLTEAGMISWAPGHNRQLTAMREALGMNEKGQSFSMRAMEGRPIRVKIKHETYEGDLFDRVDSVSKV